MHELNILVRAMTILTERIIFGSHSCRTLVTTSNLDFVIQTVAAVATDVATLRWIGRYSASWWMTRSDRMTMLTFLSFSKSHVDREDLHNFRLGISEF